jgi:hypothetical protein
LPAARAAWRSTRLQDELRWTNFLLAYQGEDDRALQVRYGELRRSHAAAGRSTIDRAG